VIELNAGWDEMCKDDMMIGKKRYTAFDAKEVVYVKETWKEWIEGGE